MSLGGPDILIVVVVIALLFGAKRLPELGKSLGEGIKEFKKSATDSEDEHGTEEARKPNADSQS